MGSALRGWLSSEDAVIPEEAIKPPGKTDEQLKQETTQQMLDSQADATDAAMRQLGVTPTSTQVLVFELTPNSPSAGKLAPGDRIVSVNGTRVTSERAAARPDRRDAAGKHGAGRLQPRR